jgi:hypothetical protein
MSRQQRDTEERTGEYGGDDGARENERTETTPGEHPGSPGAPTGKSPAERKQDEDLKMGEENPA